MNIFLNKIFIFATGVAVGSFITWKILDSQYEIVDDELDMDKKDDTVEKREDPKTTNKEIIDENKYTTYSDNKKKEKGDIMDGIYVISPEEFGEDNDYGTESLTYYTDGIITDTYDNVIEDPIALIGDGVRHFGEYEDDSVFVRNENNKTDYEILADYKSYKETFTEGQ